MIYGVKNFASNQVSKKNGEVQNRAGDVDGSPIVEKTRFLLLEYQKALVGFSVDF